MPHGATPTNHVLKLPLGLIGGMKLDMRHMVENEWLCAQILAAYGLPVAACQPFCFDDIQVLAVERFDRVWWTAPQGDRRLVRLHQEDMCQAKGLPPTAKYEAAGGPGIDAIFQVLEGSLAREQDRRVFFQAQAVVDDLVARTPAALALVRAQLPHGFPADVADVADSILEGVQGAAARLAA